MPKFTLLVAFRNRDIPRADRFLTSLGNQSFTDFELFFLDYGSDEPIASQVAELCSLFDFCNYKFLNTNGKYWNKCVAFNTGIQLSKSEYIICTDIDMIFTKDVLAAVNNACGQAVQVYSRIYLLPETFSDFDSLNSYPVGFPITGETSLGGLQCVKREHFLALQGFDEYYSIWGLEDLDMTRRLERFGLEIKWLTHTTSPIYHQWHPRIAVQHFHYPDAWWDDMNHHFVIEAQNLKRNKTGWGYNIHSPESRPAIELEVYKSITIPAMLNPFDRTAILGKILELITQNSGKRVQINCMKRIDRKASGSYVLNKLNSTLISLGIPVNLVNPKSSRRKSGIATMHHFLLTLLNSTQIIGDYTVVDLSSQTQFNIVVNEA